MIYKAVEIEVIWMVCLIWLDGAKFFKRVIVYYSEKEILMVTLCV